MRLKVIAVALLVATSAAAQEKDKPLPGDEMIYKYLCAETDKLSQKFLDGAKTIEEWKEKRPRLKREYMDMLGLWPIPEKTPLKATITGQIEAHGVIVEKLHYQSKPGLYVTANLYRPKEDASAKRKRLPAILYVCGHSGRGRDGNKVAFQDHGFWFANNGYVCLVVDTLQLGEIPGVHHGTYGRPWNHIKAYGLTPPAPPQPFAPSPLFPQGADNQPTRFWWHSAGYTPAGVECWNGVRGIDYLLTRPEVDPERIGVTGISGGGAATFWIAAADERVKVAVPVSGMSDLESYVKNKVVNGHCDCMFLYNNYQWEWTTIAALIAPRPMLFANSDNDPIFPMDGNRRIIERLRKIYTMYGTPPSPPSKGGAGGVVDEYVSKGGHAYRPDLRVAIFKFINKHLKGDTTTPVEDSEKYTDLPGEDLRVFATDADIPKDAINARIDETFVPRAKVELPAKGKFGEWKNETLIAVRNRCFAAMPAEIQPAGNPLLANPFGSGKTGKITLLYSDVELMRDDIDLVKFAKQFRHKDDLFMMVMPRFFAAPPRPADLQEMKQGYHYAWTKKSPPNYVERSHVLLGRTLDQERVQHLIAFIKRMQRDNDPKNQRKFGGILLEKGANLQWKVVAEREAGILAAYAALFAPSIKEVVVIDPPKSHLEGPHFLGILKVLDIPEALGLLAPTPLTIVGGDNAAFDRTAEIYRRAGAADKLKRVKK